MLTWLQTNLLWTEGIQILVVLVALLIGSFLLYRPLAVLVLGLLFFSFYFFRNPERICIPAQTDPTVIVCPADGKIVDIQSDHNNGLEGYTYKISIFLSPIDVHVNWSPIAGTVQKITYKEGAFTVAFLPKSSELNERNDIQICGTDGRTVLVRQIAGTIARRIRCWVHETDAVTPHTKVGMIKFGSRVDLFLPADVELAVGTGQRVYGGQTVIGRWICAC